MASQRTSKQMVIVFFYCVYGEDDQTEIEKLHELVRCDDASESREGTRPMVCCAKN